MKLYVISSVVALSVLIWAYVHPDASIAWRLAAGLVLACSSAVIMLAAAKRSGRGTADFHVAQRDDP